MEKLAEVAAFVLGLFIVLGTVGSLMRTLVVPRGTTSRLIVIVSRLVRNVFLFLAIRFKTYDAKDKVLALSAPVSLLVQLLVWLLLFLVGYALMLWPVTDFTFLAALRESGSSMLTLGFSSTPGRAATAIDLIAATTGLIVVALQIAYLPTLYAAFNRRETLVTMLQSRAGSPAWGPEILARHQLVGLTAALPEFFDEWERWAAEVAETHTTYPVLVSFRSPHPLRSWILGLLAVLDAAALYLALNPNSAPTQTRLLIRMGFTALRNIADVVRIPYDPDPFPDDPIELSYEEFMIGIDRLRNMDFPMERTPEEAWPHFRGWRVNYEGIAYQLAENVVAPPGPWSGERTRLRNVTIVPERPRDRTPDDPGNDKAAETASFGWRWKK